MARLRHIGARRKAGRLSEETTTLKRTMRHDERFGKIADKAIDNLDALERRAAEIVVTEDATDCTLTSREPDDLRRLAADGNEEAAAELRRREVLEPAAA
ncbi:MAG TPA: hypothetical protein VF245_12815 [Solirubrobacterales bacterium]